MATIPQSTITNSWVITQLRGDKKSVTLSGWTAPFGRPRQKPVVRSPIEIREKTVYYPGNPIPTRHVFGVKWDDFELNGRWMDGVSGSGFAKSMVAFMNDLVNDQIDVQIRWGRILSFQGLIKKFDPGWESEGTVEWKLKILINQDDSVVSKSKSSIQPEQRTPSDHMASVLALLVQRPLTTFPISTPGNILDAIQNVVSTINQGASNLIGFATQITDFETATYNDLARLRAGILQLKTELLSFKETQASLASDSLLLSQNSNELIQLQDLQSTSDVQMIATVGALEAMDKAALAAQRGRSSATYTAKDGDTWERISILEFGDPSEANSIRQANGIKFGTQPSPGQTYNIPAPQ